MLNAIYFGSSHNNDVFWSWKLAQTTVGALRTLDRLLVRVRHNYKKVQIAVLCWATPGM